MAARYLKYLASTSLKFSPIKFRPTMSTTRCLSEQSFQVEHDEANREFFIKLGNDKAVLQYEVLNPKTLDLVHTEVPEALRGKGIAKHLAKAAFDYVVSKDLQVRLTCTYLIKYCHEARNPEYTKHVVQ
ncbi:protein NATD1 isoform X3 [Ixodes scapularis]|uniref:protein NATD1 isoform X3 n=1 Tax=Ixodes scapularis TaxID=6945 RepID=UPI001A9F52F5|nr:protein NATD1 isoform X3 [Ixodes scapularis]